MPHRLALEEIAPSVVPKASAKTGLVYTYTKPQGSATDDPWYLTALDFDTGKTRWKRLAGEGLGYNNNYAPDHDRPGRADLPGRPRRAGGVLPVAATSQRN